MTTLMPVKSYLGKYYPEIRESTLSDKYKNTSLELFLEQRFHSGNNQKNVIIDPAQEGLSVTISGNEVHISNELFEHPSIIITNVDDSNTTLNPRSNYDPLTFSTIAYLACKNYTNIQIVGDVDQPIYIRYINDFESFYNSVIMFTISNDREVEIVEEFESVCALNVVSNYVLHPSSTINLTTFYKNHRAGISFCYRNIIMNDNSIYNHTVLGKGSSNVIDENKLSTGRNTVATLKGVINSTNNQFHSILYVQPATDVFSVDVDYRNLVSEKSNVTFLPIILGDIPGTSKAAIDVSSLELDDIPDVNKSTEIQKYISPILETVYSSRSLGIEKFIDNKTKFLQLL